VSEATCSARTGWEYPPAGGPRSRCLTDSSGHANACGRIPMADQPPIPLITVALPFFNAGEHLRIAVLSVLRQSFTNWELLVIDDGSTDNSVEQIADFDDPRIRIDRDGHNRGLAARLNQAIDAAGGKFLARMDHDDISYPGRFASQVAFLSEHPQVDLVGVRAIRISPRSEFEGFFPSPLSHAEICAKPWKGFYLPHPTWMGRIEWFRRFRYTIPEARKKSISIEDQDLLLRSYRDSTFACVNEIQFAYRSPDRIRLGKRIRTRWTVVGLQAAEFARDGRLGFAIRAAAIFLVRVGSDLRKYAVQALSSGTKRRGPPPAADPAARQWAELKDSFWPNRC
jgi:glycosyltransferase involved in cell wall biosynthesis